MPKSVLQRLPASEQSHPRRGPKPKLIKDRTFKPEEIKPIRRPERSWSQFQKIRILVFLFHHRIPLNEYNQTEYRSPTQEEASEIFGVPQRTISDWVHRQDKIEKLGASSTVRSQRTSLAVICKWPDLEVRLYSLFLERREQGQAIRRGWFRIHANVLFCELYPEVSTSVFRFSNGWFEAFLGRFRISLRCITKKAQKIPEDYRNLIISWLQFNRRNSQQLLLPDPNPRILVGDGFHRITSRYRLSNICNLDETPLPFEYLNGRTYNPIGAKTIWVKETRSGWDKRQASLVLCVFADGVNRIPPMIIFHGTGKRLGKEFEKYHPGVIVEFNETAYMTDQLFLKYIESYLVPALENRPSLFALDLCTSHKTPAVLGTLRSHNIIPSLIPAGCTSLVQPLDVSINKPLKERIRDLTDEAIFEYGTDKWSVGDRRVLTTWCVGDAWYQFCIERQEVIKKSFRDVGLSLPIDGSADHELDIKGFEDIDIGDWRIGSEPERDLDLGTQFADVSMEHDNNELVEFVAYGE